VNCVIKGNKTGIIMGYKNNSSDRKLNVHLKGNIRSVHVVSCLKSVKYEKCAVTYGRREAKGI
jgi:hypothetical protein